MGIIHLFHSDRTCTCIKMSGITYTWINFNSKSQLCECIQNSVVHFRCYRCNVGNSILRRTGCRSCPSCSLCTCSHCRCRCNCRCNFLRNNLLFGSSCILLSCSGLYNRLSFNCCRLVLFFCFCAWFLLRWKSLSIRFPWRVRILTFLLVVLVLVFLFLVTFGFDASGVSSPVSDVSSTGSV